MGFMCDQCAYNWRGCHNPKRPNVTWSEGCKDYRWKHDNKDSQVHKPDLAWIEGLDFSSLSPKTESEQYGIDSLLYNPLQFDMAAYFGYFLEDEEIE